MWLFLLATAFAGLIFSLVVAAIVSSTDRRPLGRIVDDTARQTVASKLPGIIAKIVDDVMGLRLPDGVPLTRMQFELRVVQHLRRNGADWEYARSQGLNAVAQFLADEKIEFGQGPESWSWDASSAREIAEEYEVRHWDFAPQ